MIQLQSVELNNNYIYIADCKECLRTWKSKDLQELNIDLLDHERVCNG